MRPTLSKAIVFVLESRRRLWLAVIVATVVFGTFEFLVSQWLLGLNIPPALHGALHASIVGIGAGAAAYMLLLATLERRRMIADELRRVGELNHTVRNSLEVIVLAHHQEADCEHKEMVLECTNRIDQSLRKLFPVIGRRLMPDERVGAESIHDKTPE